MSEPRKVQGTEYLSKAGLARRKGLDVKFIDKALRHPTSPLPHIIVSGRRFFTVAKFDAWMDAQTVS